MEHQQVLAHSGGDGQHHLGPAPTLDGGVERVSTMLGNTACHGDKHWGEEAGGVSAAVIRVQDQVEVDLYVVLEQDCAGELVINIEEQ